MVARLCEARRSIWKKKQCQMNGENENYCTHSQIFKKRIDYRGITLLNTTFLLQRTKTYAEEFIGNIGSRPKINTGL